MTPSERLERLLAQAAPVHVTTTEPLTVRRRHAGTIENDLLPAGSRCTLACTDDPVGTFLLVDAVGDEVWSVRPDQFELLSARHIAE